MNEFVCLFVFVLRFNKKYIYTHAMGIHNLAKLIADQAPAAIKEGEMANYFGRKIAIDA